MLYVGGKYAIECIISSKKIYNSFRSGNAKGHFDVGSHMLFSGTMPITLILMLFARKWYRRNKTMVQDLLYDTRLPAGMYLLQITYRNSNFVTSYNYR